MKKHVTIKQPGERFVNVYLEGDSVEEILENAFAAFNHGSGQEHELFLASSMRSLSVNDLVRIGTTWYQCESIGWKEVTEQYVDDLEKAVVEHPSYALHGAWFALSELAWERKKALKAA